MKDVDDNDWFFDKFGEPVYDKAEMRKAIAVTVFLSLVAWAVLIGAVVIAVTL